MVNLGMNKYLSEEFIIKLLDAHLEDSRGAEHYAYDVIKREIVAAPGVVIEPWDSEIIEIKCGQWIEDYVYDPDPHDRIRYKCSVCGRTEESKQPYCNCGAKMM